MLLQQYSEITIFHQNENNNGSSENSKQGPLILYVDKGKIWITYCGPLNLILLVLIILWWNQHTTERAENLRKTVIKGPYSFALIFQFHTSIFNYTNSPIPTRRTSELVVAEDFLNPSEEHLRTIALLAAVTSPFLYYDLALAEPCAAMRHPIWKELRCANFLIK